MRIVVPRQSSVRPIPASRREPRGYAPRRPHAARLPLRTTRGGFSEFHVAGLRARRSVLPYLLCRRYAARLQRSRCAGDRRAAERSCRAIHRRRKRKRLFRSGRRANQLPRRVRQDGRKPMYRNAVADTPRTGGRLLRLRLVAMDVQRIELEADRIVAEELDRARQKIIENHVAAGQRTTGTTADSITIAVTTNGGVTTGTMDARPYFAALETGTQPWQSQHFRRRRDGSVYPSAPKWFIDIIADWAATKGVDISAWGAATKIMTEGSALFRNGGREDIFTPEIAALSDRIADRLAGLFDAQIVESILRQ